MAESEATPSSEPPSKEELKRALKAFRKRLKLTLQGYRLWADWVVRRMKRSKRVHCLVRRLALPFIQRLAQGGPNRTPIGALLGVGIAICWMLGAVIAASRVWTPAHRAVALLMGR